ncbi:hypothetical protein OJ997_36030 [Solirubrobacter phytolaccae]|uniref:Uncharacterized protein n=1 Tax=Solirubrobacter phytolaccae TaxID=1404360 RepID=A0A9X3NFH6_9ACTN|nr:hypothetical protein [Solirubrobacter phytolaccae]MDA0185770.1 hypothetical protein [Solirubrobacter phytolaccae]
MTGGLGLRAAIGIPLGAVLAFALVGAGFLNYDTAYSLLWGGDVLHGRTPDFDVPLAPTPHPLATALGMLLFPLGDAGQTIWVIIAFLSLGALGWVTYELGAHWFGPAAGVVAAVLILTRVPVLSFGVRAYFDIPYVALALGAILAEARGKNPRLVLVLLGLAGLLRPEPWGLAILYVLWKRDLRLLPWALAAPVIWMVHDQLLAGNPLHSLTDTQDNAKDLQRITGLDDVPLTVPRRLGEILREPGLLGAAAGGILVLAFMRRRAGLLVAAGFVAIGAFCVLATAGLPILGRYLLLPAAILAIFAGAGVFGWRTLERDHPWRRRWAAFGGVVLLAALVFAPSQVNRIENLRSAMHTQQDILADLHAISDDIACEPVAVPNHRPVPHIALWTGIAPAEIVSAQLEQPTSGSYIDPASERVERNFTLDPRDPKRLTAAVPPGFSETARNESWVLAARC